MPFCGVCLETFDEEDSVGGLNDICPRCYEQQMRDSEDAVLVADLESELAAVRRQDFAGDDAW